jgi:circadian clock protein KaiC
LLVEQARQTRPARIVFDSLSEFRLMAETPLRYRRQLLSLKQEFARLQSTVLLLDDKMDKPGVSTDPHVMSISHGVLEMEQRSPDYGIPRRRLRVAKLRGIQYREGWHDYSIFKGGLRVFPRLIAAEHHVDFQREPASSGNKDLDSLLGGGLDRGTTTLVLGAAGTGKSSLALHYAASLAQRGERSSIFTFDETLGIMLARARGLGLPLDEHIQSGLILAQQVDPAELSPGEFAVRVQQGVEDGVKLVVIDSLNGYLNAMPGEQYLSNQLHELSSYLNQLGVITIIIMAQHGFVATLKTPVDLSYLADTVVALRFFETEAIVKQAISVIKKRSGHHEKNVREFTLEKGTGIRIGPPLKDFRGILGGHSR